MDMDTKKALITGIDLANDTSQICYYDRESREMTSVEFPDGSLLHDNEYSLDAIFSMDETEKLMQIKKLLQLLLTAVRTVTGIEKLQTICITMDDFNKERASIIGGILEKAGYCDVAFITHNESYACYAFNRKKEMWSGGTLLFDFNKKGFYSDELHLSNINHSDIITEEYQKHVDIALCPVIRGEKSLTTADEFLTRLAKELLNSKKISTIYLTGEFFDDVELPENFIAFICNHRRVFAGQNLYAKGACCQAAKKAGIEDVRTLAFGGRNMITTGLDLVVNEVGTNRLLSMVKPGTSWYNAVYEGEFLVESAQDIVLRLLPFEDGKEYFEHIILDGFPCRNDRSMRVRINFEAENEFFGYLTVTDLGFGEFEQATQKTIRQKIELNYSAIPERKMIRRISFEDAEYPLRKKCGLIGCKKTHIGKPLLLQAIDLRIYTLEELAYYMFHNVYLLGDEFGSEQFLSFLREELKVKKLADTIEKMIKIRAGLAEIVIAVLKYSGIYSAQEIASISDVLDTLNTQNVYERICARADSYLKNRCYLKAMQDYKQILTGKKDPSLSGLFYAKVWHNMGVACASMFAFDHAVKYFEEAYRVGQHEESHRMALAAREMYKLAQENTTKAGNTDAAVLVEDAEILESVKDEIEKNMNQALYTEEYKNLEKIHQLKQNGMVGQYYDSLEGLLESWKHEYRKFL